MTPQLLKKLSWISVLVIIALVGATLLPDYAEAYAAKKARQEQANRKHEIVDLRTENSKTYVKGDNTYVLEQYLEPIHFKEKGHWEEIDNRITTVSSTQALDTDLSYQNKANRYRVGFAKNSRANKLVRFQLGQAGVDFGLTKDAQSTNAVVKNNQLTYRDVYPDTHLVYYADNTGIKEEWVLDKYNGQSVFTLTLNTRGVTAEQQKDGSIHFVDAKGKVQFSIPRPFMVDQNLRSSDEVSYTIRKEGNTTYLDLKVDEGWLKEPDRAFPVRLDPSLEIKTGNFDTFVGEAQPTSNFYNYTYLTVGKNPDHGRSRAFLKFKLQPLLSGAKIISSRFSMYQALNNSNTERINVHPVTESWINSTVTWNTQPAVGAAVSHQDVTGPGWTHWYLTDLTKDWYSGKTMNRGISLRMATEMNDRKSWHSMNYTTDTSLRPKLTVMYEIDPLGVESFWTTAVSNVNTYNGNFFLPETDVSIPGRGIPASVERAYNSRAANSGIFGTGWTSNLEQKLTDNTEPKTTDHENGPILYTDPDGTPHTFAPNWDGGTYSAPGGVYLELEKKSDGTYILEDTDQTKYQFNTSGRLTSITDANNNKTTIGYTGSNPTSITDASGRKVTLSYNTDNRVSNVTDPAGRSVEYTYDATGNLKTVTQKDAAGKVMSTVTYGYDAGHRMTSIKDPNGNVETIEYDSGDRVKKISHPLTVDGQVKTATSSFLYDATNRITTVTNPKGTPTVYTHNEYGNVIQITQDPSGLNYKQTFQYNDKNELVSEKDANANAKGSDATYNYTYDGKGNLTSVTNPLNEKSTTEYDENNNPVKETDPEGNTTINEYDDKGNPTSSTDPVEKSSATKVDSYGNVIEETAPISPGDNLARNGSFEIDRNSDNWPDDWYQWTASGATKVTWTNGGLVVDGITLGKKRMQIVSPGEDTLIGNSKLIPYDPKKAYFVSGYVSTSSAQGIAGIQATGYDANGNITKRIKSNEISGTHSPTRLHVAVEPDAFPTGTTTFRIRAYVFGKNGQYDGTYRFDGLQVEEGFYGAYNLVENSGFERDDDPKDTVPDRWFMSPETETADGVTTAEQHTGKSSGKLVGKTNLWKSYYQDLPVSGAAGAIFTVSGFSKVSGPKKDGGIYGYIIKTYQGSTEQETFTYHFNKNKSHDWEHKAAQIKATKPFDRIRVHFEYSQQTGTAWFDTAKVIPGSITTTHEYDAKSNYETKTADPQGRVVESGYDAVGNVTSEKKGADTTTFTYDGLDRLTHVTDVKQGETSYRYDPNGNKTQVTNARGKTTTFEYNEMDEVRKITDPLGQSVLFSYDLNGNQTKVTQPNGDTVETGYNAVDRETSVSHNGTKKYSFEYDANGNVTQETDEAKNESTTFTYDDDNKLKTVTEPGSNKTEYTHDKNGNVTQQKLTAGTSTVTQGMGYNEVDQLTQVTENGKKRAIYTYDENDRVTSRKNEDGTVSLFHYNGAGDLVHQVVLDKDGKEREKYTYSFDSKGNITQVKDSKGTTSYVYDQLDQLIKETRPDGTVTEYTYDAAGNRLTKKVTKGGTTTTTNYSYDDADQLTQVDGQAHTFDKNGNLTHDGKRTYVYDAENRLTAVKEGDKTLASFTYRADGMRKTMTTSTGTITFHYDENNNVTYETDQDNQIVAHYTYGANNELVGMTRGGKTYYYQTNYRGDVTALTDSTGAVVASYEYDAFGNLLKKTGTLENPYLYAGYRYDEGTGLYYLQSRYYNPEMGRFLTRDAFEGFEDEQLSLNQYAYTHNNPVVGVDPDGYWVIPVLRELLKQGVKQGAKKGAKKAVKKSTKNTKKKSSTKKRSSRPPAKRYYFKSKKAAYEAAKRAGKGKRPIHHPHDKHGPHYHPNVPAPKHYTPKKPDPHDHYFYPKGRR
ncbi:DNRLRE domain-containing protein [Kroppenstedtia eburnea]|uniref:RHS repeat-associated core domain-containing protein n=1 Tax=Kroppenstedtia eburnea TaxID=714067 RepID=A0A1N7MM38_9BACL|nr:DNRLRE domain-containing protein [Kroppenstedtia eburnea]QKI81650.1 DNRLRE domain-containing protein [Kroppenstedtia eburnea]SIS87080.1 RHS repeat-associated core domain-containing protein [Kroppenstedtia eburnea]